MTSTYVTKTNGGALVSEFGTLPNRTRFAARFHRFDGHTRWSLRLCPVPDGLSYGEMLAAGIDCTEYVQAGGRADALTVEVRTPGGEQWGCRWVRYAIGRPHGRRLPLDFHIPIHIGPLKVSAAEVFDAEEAADIFHAYHQTGHIPDGYKLRPAEGFRADGSAVTVDLR